MPSLLHFWVPIPVTYKLSAFSVVFAALLAALGWGFKKVCLKRPKLRGAIVAQVTLSVVAESANTEEADITGDLTKLFTARMMLRVRVVNYRPYPVTVRVWILEATQDAGGKKWKVDVQTGRLARVMHLLSNVNFLHVYCRENALQYGKHVEGLLYFEFPGMDTHTEKDVRLTLWAIDGLGHRHKITKTRLDKIPNKTLSSLLGQ